MLAADGRREASVSDIVPELVPELVPETAVPSLALFCLGAAGTLTSVT